MVSSWAGTWAPPDFLRLNGRALRLVGGTRPERTTITQFPRPIQVGANPRIPDQHALLSTLDLSTWEGGVGREVLRQAEEGTGRYWIGNLDTRWPGVLCCAPLSVAMTLPGAGGVVAPNSVVTASDDAAEGLWMPGYRTTAASGTRPALYNEIWHVVPPNELAADGLNPFNGATAYENVPSASVNTRAFQLSKFGGYTLICRGTIPPIADVPYAYLLEITGAGVTGPTGTLFDAIVGLGDQAWGFMVGGIRSATLWGTTANSSASPTTGGAVWSQEYELPFVNYNELIVDAVAGFDGRGNRAIYVLTTERVYQLDPKDGSWLDIYTLPRRFAGNELPLPSMVWWDRTQCLYVAADRTLVEITGGVYRSVSPFGDEGLPHRGQPGTQDEGDAGLAYGLGGVIADVFARRHWLGCTLRGDGVNSDVYGDRAALLLWDTRAWHSLEVARQGCRFGQGLSLNDAIYVRQQPETGNEDVVVGWFDEDSACPPWLRPVNRRRFQSGSLVSPWWDNNQPEVRKLLDTQEFQFQPNGAINSSVTIRYQLEDEHNSWQLLGTVSTEGRHRLRYGLGNGVLCYRARWEITLTVPLGSNQYTPTLRDHGLLFLPRPEPLYGWTFRVDLHEPDGIEGDTGQMTKQFLYDLNDLGTKCRLEYGEGEIDRQVMISALVESDLTLVGRDETGIMIVTVLETAPASAS